MIDIYVLNTNFEIVGVVDTYESFIWTDRWNKYGDFELYTAFDYNLLLLCQQNYYLHVNESEHTMIIEGIEVETSSEEGIKLRITGRSLESILDRRIVWKQTTITANMKFEDAVKKLLDNAFGNAFDNPIKYPEPGQSSAKNKVISDARKLETFKFQRANDPFIDGILVEKTQYTGDNLYEVVTKMCEDVNNTIGWSITLDENNNFVFQLHSGTNYSYQQDGYRKTMDTVFVTGKTYYEKNSETGEYFITSDVTKQKNKTYYEVDPIKPYVIFSPDFDNIVNTDYLDSIEQMKNVTLVAGEGEGNSRTTLIVGSASGLNRRELFTDARDLRREDYGEKYNQALKTRGTNKLVENARMQSYEGQVDATRQFIYKKDFKIGDIVQMSNEYGINGAVRIIEWVRSESSSGIETYPTFDAVQIIDDTEYEEEETT